MPPAVVDRTLYRAILRWAAQAQTIPFDVRRCADLLSRLLKFCVRYRHCVHGNSTYSTLFAYRSHIQEVLPASTFALLQATTASFKNASDVKALTRVGFRDCATLEVSHSRALSCASC